MKEEKKKQIEKVKKKLWKFGYSVKDVSTIKDVKYDLLVEEKVKVAIGTQRPTEFQIFYDVYAYVKGATILFITKPKNGLSETKSPTTIFGKK